MELTSSLLLRLALFAYAGGAVGSLLAVRRERLANCSIFALLSWVGLIICGSNLLVGAENPSGPSLELWPSLIPYVRLAVRLDSLALLPCLLFPCSPSRCRFIRSAMCGDFTG